MVLKMKVPSSNLSALSLAKGVSARRFRTEGQGGRVAAEPRNFFQEPLSFPSFDRALRRSEACMEVVSATEVLYTFPERKIFT
jgi:hypothetical protein